MTTNRQVNPVNEEQDAYTFKREDGQWYIQLPASLEKGWSKPELRLTEGAPKFLNTLSNGAPRLRLRISLERHAGWDVLELINHCEAPKGGAIYLFTPGGEQAFSSLFWICDLSLFVFGDMPEHIYVLRLPVKGHAALHSGNSLNKDYYRKPQPDKLLNKPT